MNNFYYGADRTPHLSHHGIKGQRWGVRRYQNPDGTLTVLGRARYGVQAAGRILGNKLQSVSNTIRDKYKERHLDRMSEEELQAYSEKLRERERRKQIIGDLEAKRDELSGKAIKDAEKKRNNPKKMTDDEIKNYINRLNMEKQYKNLKEELYGKKPKERKPSRLANFIDGKAERLAGSFIDRAISEAVNKTFSKKDTKISDLKKMMSNPNAYSDSDWERVSKKAEAIAKTKNAIGSIDAFAKENSKVREAESDPSSYVGKTFVYNYFGEEERAGA